MNMDSPLRRAIGVRGGDDMTLANQWAKVTIKRGEAHRGRFVVFGDCDTQEFNSAARALAYALKNLAEFADGRAD